MRCSITACGYSSSRAEPIILGGIIAYAMVTVTAEDALSNEQPSGGGIGIIVKTMIDMPRSSKGWRG